MWKELLVYQDCMWYISCEGMHVYMPRAIDASGWFSAGSPKKIWFTLLCYLLCGGDKIGNVSPADC